MTNAGAGLAAAVDGAGLGAAGGWAQMLPGHWKLPRWFRMICIFSLIDLDPSRWLSALQHATQLPSSFVPPLALATRCSTEASAFASSLPQKKHWLPWANRRRSRCVVMVDNSLGCRRTSYKHSIEARPQRLQLLHGLYVPCIGRGSFFRSRPQEPETGNRLNAVKLSHVHGLILACKPDGERV